jgi:hypothetical protein
MSFGSRHAVTPNPRLDTDAQRAAFVRSLGAGHAQRWASMTLRAAVMEV